MNEPSPLFAGCAYVVAIGHKGKSTFKIFCNKVCASGSEYCPKHQLFIEDEGKEPERRRQQRRAKKEYRKDELEALASSPLAAINPVVEKKSTRYTEPE